MNPETIADLQDSIYDWQIYNFGEQDKELTLLGVYEEAGELCHAQLKMEQGIRGTSDTLEAEMRDAIGDIMIYSMNFLSSIGKQITLYRLEPAVTTDNRRVRQAVASVFHGAGRINAADPNSASMVDQMVITLANLCSLKGWNLEEIVRATWREVGKRDWKKYPGTGRPEAE